MVRKFHYESGNGKFGTSRSICRRALKAKLSKSNFSISQNAKGQNEHLERYIAGRRETL